MKEYAYKKIDAFTQGSSLGNPAACIYLEQGQTLSDEEMLFIAKQHKGFVSEMVYCTKTPEAYELIYYSSECEVDFCGHGTIACMYSLIKSTPALLEQPELKIHTRKKGPLTVYNGIPGEDAVFITAPAPVFTGTSLSLGTVAENLGLGADQLDARYPVDCINAGLNTLIVPITTLKDEISLFPGEAALKAFCEKNGVDIILIFSLEVRDAANRAHTRVFAPKFGYLEDPATGSGNSAFGHYLKKNGLWRGEAISLEQGGEDRVFNTVRLKLQGNSLLFGGRATERIVGTYLV